ncbi:PspA/IM30 family protein [Cutibacterium granulosum]|uniref:PspA/IM30 family protein n=1 Tax=Cutibacterium granulosum TaxID=33011 RepID=UPI002574735D|nr:PspA/IM30 family protein [Cutibacterium granulosum]MDU1778975.1 PspA/IM30 family protein [Propionibacterium sp.]MDU1523299.1 PspA/IM30 family protein [Cutibacterium granulosum]MDU1863653.1 PspA/IM30 family protein [Propionibacterium sp.]MDU3768957.1 PspA/IM30 family protein [Cutibacterium granulosum]MDU3822050.1 PspA/IM30 family protein [Cutibacterium granulosum]
MAGIFERLSTVFRSKANKALDKVEDPRDTLDYSYQKQLELLQKVRRGIADVATSRKRLELRMRQLAQESDRLENQAKRALEQGREDLAREALRRKGEVTTQLQEMQNQYASLQEQEEKLIAGQQRLQAKVDAFRTKKETLKATYSAAEAQNRINDAFSGLGEEMGDVGMAIQRAEDKTMQLQARAGAVDELMATGAIDDVTGLGGDDIDRELNQFASSSAVENDLAELKKKIAIENGSQPEQLEAGPSGSSAVNRSQTSGGDH